MLLLNPYPETPILRTEDATCSTTSSNVSPHSFAEMDIFDEMGCFLPETIAQISLDSVHKDAALLTSHILSSGFDPTLSADLLIPSAGRILAMLIDDRDSEDYQDMSGISYPAELKYNYIAFNHEEMASLRSRYSALFTALYTMLKAAVPPLPSQWIEPKVTTWRGDVTLPGLFSFPSPQDLDYSHTFALDIFLRDMDYLSGDVQRGPSIHSISDGLVVATGVDWLGYPRKSRELSFIHGGISPKSGNGVIIFSPYENRYYLYFHLYDVAVEKGQIVQRGQPIGRSGNSGINARKKGGGDHLHMEIFDASKEKYYKNTDIIALLRASSKHAPAFSTR